MKKNSVAMLSLILIFIIFASACAREYSYGRIERDNSLTGGDLSFIYDENTHTAIFGGEGEIIAFYEEDRLAGLPKGNRIGFKIYAPCDVQDFSKAKMTFQGKEYLAGSFMQTVYDQTMNYFVLTPVVSKDNSSFDVKVVWNQNAKEQVYHIKIAQGTVFASEQK